MGMQLGTNSKAREEILNSGFDTIKNLSEIGQYQHRILSGGFRMNEIYYPTIRKDAQTGELKSSWNLIKVPKEGHLLSKLIVLDEKLKSERAEKSLVKGNIRSRLHPSTSYLYLIFDRKEPELKIEKVRYKYSIVKDLVRLENERDPADDSKLMNGPAFCWDAIINHKKDESKKGAEWMKHEYTVSVYSASNKCAGRIPAEVWNSNRFDSPWEVFVEKGWDKAVFAEKELELINSCDVSLEEVTRALTDDEIMEELVKFPLFPGAIDSNNAPIFADPEAIWKEIQRLELPASSQEEIKMIGEGVVVDTMNVDIDDFGELPDKKDKKKVEFDTELSKESKKKGRPTFTEEI